MPQRMHAVVQQAFGGPEVLEVTEVDRPVPLATEVLVRVEAVGVNPVEPLIRSGQFPLIGQPPFILGWDVSGVIEGLEGVTRFEVGDEVYGMPFFPRAASAYAQYVAAPSRQLARKPSGLSHAEAAALPLAGLTAWQSLVDTARLAAGQRVLIHGAGGGVGHLAVQIAKARGAYVVGTASAAKHEFVRSLGADELIDHQTCDFAAVVGDLDVVLDSLGGEIARRSISVLRPGGTLITTVGRRDSDLAARTRAAGRRFAVRRARLSRPRSPGRTGRFRAAPGPSPDDAAPGRGGQGPPAPRVRPHHRQDRADYLETSLEGALKEGQLTLSAEGAGWRQVGASRARRREKAS